MLKQTMNTNNSKISVFKQIYNVKYCTKTAKMLDTQISFTVTLLYSQKDAPAKFHLSATFGLSFMISSVASTSSPTFYAYLITKIRIHNLKSILTEFIKILFTFLVPKNLDVSWKILDLTGGSKKSSVFYLTIRDHSFIQLYLTSVRKNSSKGADKN